MKPFLSVFSLIFLIVLSLAEDSTTTTTEETVTITGYTSLCSSCIDFVSHLPGIQDAYEKGVGIDPNTLCTAVALKMPSVGEPCFKLFAEYWSTVQNATILEICATFYFC